MDPEAKALYSILSALSNAFDLEDTTATSVHNPIDALQFRFWDTADSLVMTHGQRSDWVEMVLDKVQATPDRFLNPVAVRDLLKAHQKAYKERPKPRPKPRAVLPAKDSDHKPETTSNAHSSISETAFGRSEHYSRSEVTDTQDNMKKDSASITPNSPLETVLGGRSDDMDVDSTATENLPIKSADIKVEKTPARDAEGQKRKIVDLTSPPHSPYRLAPAIRQSRQAPMKSTVTSTSVRSSQTATTKTGVEPPPAGWDPDRDAQLLLDFRRVVCDNCIKETAWCFHKVSVAGIPFLLHSFKCANCVRRKQACRFERGQLPTYVRSAASHGPRFITQEWARINGFIPTSSIIVAEEHAPAAYRSGSKKGTLPEVERYPSTSSQDLIDTAPVERDPYSRAETPSDVGTSQLENLHLRDIQSPSAYSVTLPQPSAMFPEIHKFETYTGRLRHLALDLQDAAKTAHGSFTEVQRIAREIKDVHQSLLAARIEIGTDKMGFSRYVNSL